MADLFFGNKDIVVMRELAATPFTGKLDYPWLITDEAEIPETLIYDYDGISDFEDYLTSNSLTAPKLVEGLKIAFTQKDKEGNIIAPNCGFIVVTGIELDMETQAFYDELEQRLSDSSQYFYSIGFIQPTTLGKKWGNTYPKYILPYFYQKTEDAIAADSQGGLRVFVDINDQLHHIAEMANFVFPTKFRPLKFMALTGVNPDSYTDGEVNVLDEKGLAVYRTVNKKGEVSNSLSTDLKYLDTKFIMDTIVYNLANSLQTMFRENEVFDDNVATLIRKYTDTTLEYVANDLNMISRTANGTFNYSINIPEITGKVRTLRDLSGIEWKFIQKTPIEKVQGTAIQVQSEEELVITGAQVAGVSL